LHPVLKRLQRKTHGFNILRRRMTHVEKSDCPEALKHFWSGHAPRPGSERCVKLFNGSAVQIAVGRKNRAWFWVADELAKWASGATLAVSKSGLSC